MQKEKKMATVSKTKLIKKEVLVNLFLNYYNLMLHN